MIYASGVVTFLAGQKEVSKIKKFKSKWITLEVKKEVHLPDASGKLICDFTAILPKSYECRSLEDYTGKVKPFLQQEVGSIIVSVQVSHLNYLSERAILKMRKRH